MKKLILTTLSLLVTSLVFSQTITVDLSEIESFACPGKVDAYYTIANKEWSAKQSVNTKYIINLDQKVCKFYRDGVFASKTDFVDVTKKGDTYYITLLDYDLNSPTDNLNTHIIVNAKNNIFMFYWYDDIWNFTKVETPLVSNINVKP